MNINLKENEEIEFKESLAQLDKGLKSLSSMLNKNNHGAIYFGIKDNGDICGVFLGDNTLKDIRQRVKELIKPQIMIYLETKKYGDKDVVILSSEGSNIPYSCDGRYFIRNVSSDDQIEPQLLRKMFEAGDPDLLANYKSYNQDLTFHQFIEYNKIKGLHITNENSFLKSKVFFTKEGAYNLMAFILSDQSNVSIKVVKFNGTDKSSFSERTEYGNQCLLNSINDVLAYVKNLNTTKIDVISSTSRKDIPLFDYESFREAWINACLHNRWVEMIPPSVFIYDDRIEVLSYGDLPYNLSKESFYSGTSVPVNRALKDIFMSVGLSEQSGHGVPIIVSHYGKDAFSFESSTIKVTLPFAYEPDYVLGRKVRENVVNNLNENQRKVLNYILENPYASQQEIANKLNISLSNIKKITIKLQEINLLERKAGKKSGYWQAKLYL